MSKGHVFLAQNSKIDYVTQAYALACSIKNLNDENKTCIITNDFVPDDYHKVFDHVIKIPFNDDAKDKEWKIENRWKIIHSSPFDENLVYDTDMLLLTSNDHWWKYLKDCDLAFTTNVFDYRNNLIRSRYYRKMFDDNYLSDIYTGVYYFKKTDLSYNFFKWLEIITKNYEEFYQRFSSKSSQKFCSMDVNSALAIKFMGIEDRSYKNILSFVHMKPSLQGWDQKYSSWVDAVPYYFDGKNLIVGNYLQTGLFHYVDDRFLTSEVIEALKNER